MALTEAEELELLELEEAEYQASKKKAPAKAEPSPVLPEVPEVSKLESGARGLAQGASFGLADETTGAMEAALKTMFGDDKLVDAFKNYEKYRDESRRNYKQAEEQNPMTYNAGQIGGALATSIIPGMGGANIAKLAAQGAAHGFGNSEAEGLELAGDTLKGGLIGGATGAATKALPLVKDLAGRAGTNPTIDKVMKATDVSGQVKGLANKVLEQFPDNKLIDLSKDLVGRKLTYSNPVTGTSQLVSDGLRGLQKGGQIVYQGLDNPKAMQALQKSMDFAARPATALAADISATKKNEDIIKRMAQSSRYAKVLQQAASKDQDTLNATHWTLYNSDENYRKEYNASQDEEGTDE